MIKNLVLLTGEDTFRLCERLRFYREAFRKKYPDGEIECLTKDSSLQDLQNTAFTPNLFGGKRLILLEDFWIPEKFEQAEKGKFFQRLPDFENQCTVITIESKLDKRLKLSKYLLEQSNTEQFDPLDEAQMWKWIEQYAERQGGSISRICAQILLRRCGPDLWNLSREIQKLLAAGENQITESLIETLTIPHPTVVLWDFLESLSKKSVHSAMEKFHTLLQVGNSVHEIFPMMVREVRIHALIRDGIEQNFSSKKIAEMTHLHPFVLQKTMPLTQHFSREKIEAMYDELFDIDQKMKTGKISISTDDSSEFELAIEKFILHVCQ